MLSAEAFIKLAMIHLMLNRLEPKEVDAEFHYRTVTRPTKVRKPKSLRWRIRTCAARNERFGTFVGRVKVRPYIFGFENVV